MQPDIKSYSSVLDAWAAEGNFERAEAILEKIVKQGDGNVQADVVAFTTVIKALSNSSHLNKGERADQYLEAMENLHTRGHRRMKPTVVTYKLVYKCWTKSKSHPRAIIRLKQLDKKIEGLK